MKTKLRKNLCAEFLIKKIHSYCKEIVDHKVFSKENKITLTDCIMACYAIFSLKWPSLLEYEKQKQNQQVFDNLSNLYKVRMFIVKIVVSKNIKMEKQHIIIKC